MTDNAREYIRLKILHFKLTLIQRSAGLISFLLISGVMFILFLFFTLFLSFAFIFYFRDHWGPGWAGALIVTGFYFLLGVVFFFLRKKILTDTIVSRLSKTILEEENEN